MKSLVILFMNLGATNPHSAISQSLILCNSLNFCGLRAAPPDRG